MENSNTKFLEDFNIYTDHVIDARQPDVVVVRKDVSECLVVDSAVPRDVRVEEKEKEKYEKYSDHWRELGRLWGQMYSYTCGCWSRWDTSQEVDILSRSTGHQSTSLWRPFKNLPSRDQPEF